MATRTIKVDRPEKLSLVERLYFPAILQGLRLTLRHMFGERVTLQYPDEEHTFPAIYRGVHRLNKDEHGRIKCVACEMCAAACPAHCITIQAQEVEWDDRDKIPKVFEIDELKCIFCGYCVEACPEDAIHMTQHYRMVARNREDLIFGLDKLLTLYDDTKDQPALRSVDFGDFRHRTRRPRGIESHSPDDVQKMAYPVVGVVTHADRNTESIEEAH
jgi:NADH-quinone oxidoreductase subunit I